MVPTSRATWIAVWLLGALVGGAQADIEVPSPGCASGGCAAGESEDTVALLQSRRSAASVGSERPTPREAIWAQTKNRLCAKTLGKVPDEAAIDKASAPNKPCASDFDCVLQGLRQIKTSILMTPELPTKKQLVAACPRGKDCTPSAVVDTAHNDSTTDVGICYNAPYYYAKDCIASGVSPNANASIAKPRIVKGKTCEDMGYDRWPAFYADPFYGFENNVSLFVHAGLMAVFEWVHFSSVLASCEPCLSSLLLEGWGKQWREKNPQCAR